MIDRRRLELLTHLQTLLGAFDDRTALPRVLAGLVDADHPDLAEIEYREVGGRAVRRAPARGTVLPVRAERGRCGDQDLVLEETDRGRVAWLPLRSSGADLADPPVLVVALSDRLPADAEYLDFLGLIGGRGAPGARPAAPAAGRAPDRPNERNMSEALQRSLLTPPVQRPGLQVAVRYLPASHDAQIGGDWYDAFTVRDGALALAIGDVTGHDREAAAEMAQVRNLMRGDRLHPRRAAERDHGRARRGDPRAAGRHQRHRRPGQGRAGTRRAVRAATGCAGPSPATCRRCCSRRPARSATSTRRPT